MMFQFMKLRHSSYTFRQVKVLSGVHLNDDQKHYVTSIGGTLTLGHYERRRLPTVTHQLELGPGVGEFVLGRSNQRLITQPQRQLVRATAGLGDGAQVRSYRRAFLNQETIMGTTYRRSKARINSVVVCRDEEDEEEALLLQVHSFHIVSIGEGPMTLIALGRVVEKIAIELFPNNHPVVHGPYLDHLSKTIFRVHPIL